VGKAEMKVPGGKLLRVHSTLEEGKITRILITGDFFLHPEESLEEMERQLTGIPATREAVYDALSRFFATVSPKLLGASPQSLVDVIVKSFS